MEMIKSESFVNNSEITNASLIIDIKAMLLKNEMIFNNVNKVIAQVRTAKFQHEGDALVSIYKKDKYVEESLSVAYKNQLQLMSKLDELIENTRGY